MAFQRRPRIIPGFSVEQSAALFAQFTPTDDTVQALSTPDASTRIETGDLVARAGQFLRASPGVDGMALLLPSPDLTQPGDRITVSLESPGAPLRVSCVPNRSNAAQVTRGVVNGQSRATFTVSGLLVFTSNGATGWTTPAEHPAESAALTLAIIQAAAGEVAAAVGWGDVLRVDRHSGFVTPIIDSGQGLNFQAGSTGIAADGDLTVAAVGALELEATDAHVHPTGALHLGHEGLTGSIHQGCAGLWAGVAGDFTLDSGADAKVHVSGTFEVATAAAIRLQIDSTGAWNLAGDPGLPTYVLASRGPGHPVVWQAPTAGPIGRAGMDGRQGFPGQPGAPGPAGAPGVGVPGRAGMDGRAGPPGAPGIAGSAGASGVAGAQGPPGRTVYASAPMIPGPKGDTGAAGSGGSGTSAVATAVISLGSTPVLSGTFSITTTGLTLGQQIPVWLAVSSTDPTEAEEQISFSGIATSTTNIDVYWQSVDGTPKASTRTVAFIPTSGALLSAVGSGNAITVSTVVDLTGSTSNINTTPTAGALGVVDISTLLCGGVLSFQSLTEATIDGFTAKNDGFFFFLNVRDVTTNEYLTLTENTGGTTTSIRTPATRAHRMTRNDTAMLFYSNSRWRVCETVSKLWIVSADAVTFAAQQDNYTRGGANGVQGVIRVTLTGNQTITGLVPDNNGEIVVIQNVDTAETLTIRHDDGATSTAANRFSLPNGFDLRLAPGASAMLRYDGTSSRWRMLSPASSGRLIARTVLTAGTAASFGHSPEALYFILRGVGGGAAGGGISNVAGACGAAGGSGTYAEMVFVISAATSTYTVGAAGTGVSGATGSSGTASQWTHNGVTLGLPPGTGGATLAGGATIGMAVGGVGGAAPTGATPDVAVLGQKGGNCARPSATTGFGMCGPGGSTPFGEGGALTTATTAQVAGTPGTGYGAGGTGALEGSSTTAAIAGADGTGGIWIVEEYS